MNMNSMTQQYTLAEIRRTQSKLPYIVARMLSRNNQRNGDYSLNPTFGTSSSLAIFANAGAALYHFLALATPIHRCIADIWPRKNGISFRGSFSAKLFHWAQSLARPKARKTFLADTTMMWTAKQLKVWCVRPILYVATGKGMGACAEKAVLHSFESICRGFGCGQSL